MNTASASVSARWSTSSRLWQTCQARLVSAKADAVALGGQQRGELAPFVAVAHAENDSLCFRSFACHL